MTRDEKIAEARRLHDQGLSNPAIGERLGVTASAVWKWLHPERAKQAHRRSEARPGRQAAKNRWSRDARKDPARMKPCPRCGGPTGALVWGKDEPQACRSCVAEARETRTRLIGQFWAEGLTMRQIAVKVGMSRASLQVEIVRLRDEGRDLPYRRSEKDLAAIRAGRELARAARNAA